jgi:tetratricopeptide (TPR) repeat protein
VYGSNVVDEMADAYLQVTTANADERAVFMEDLEQYETRSQLVGLQKTLEMYPDDPWSREGLAACNIALGKPQEAIRLLEGRIKLGGEPVYAMIALGSACLSSGDSTRAETLARDVIAKDPAYPLAWLGLGKALDAEKKVEEAEHAYREAAELAPALTEAHLSLADNLAKQGRLKEAAEACEEAIKLSPDTPTSYLKLADILAREQRYDDSLRHFETAQRLAPYTHPPKVLLAVSYLHNGDAEKAKKLLSEAHADLPDHPVPELFLGQAALRDKRFDDARRYLTAAASHAIPSNWPESHRKRFLVLLNTERFKLAQQLNDEALARTAVDEWIKYDPENQQLQEIYNSLYPTGIR